MDDDAELPSLAARALAWTYQEAEQLSEATPWAHDTIYRDERHRQVATVNQVRVSTPPQMSRPSWTPGSRRRRPASPPRRVNFDAPRRSPDPRGRPGHDPPRLRRADLGRDELEIGALYTLLEFRGRGLGTALTRTALAAAGDVRDVWISADAEDRPQHLYARLGFRRVLSTAMFLRIVRN